MTISFGTLMSQPDRSKEEMNSGVNRAMLELSWRMYEPSANRFNEQYIRELREAVQIFQKSGRKVTLALGLHDTPTWVHAIKDSHFMDQYGNVSEDVNVVFNAELRSVVARYIEHVLYSLGPNSFDAVRLTSGGLGEVLYPPGGSYWAFDANARGGLALPKTLRKNPVPGFIPGKGSTDRDKSRLFAKWYIGALVNVLVWQRTVLTANGFQGEYYVLTPGVGVRPSEFEVAINHGLPNGLLGIGAAWYHLYSMLPVIDGFVVYCTSVADSSGDDDISMPSDMDMSLYDIRVLKWSAVRLQARIARGRFMPISGENPGYGYSYRSHYRDLSVNGMMEKARKQIVGCGLESFYWAHDHNLWNGDVPFRMYAQMIRKVNR